MEDILSAADPLFGQIVFGRTFKEREHEAVQRFNAERPRIIPKRMLLQPAGQSLAQGFTRDRFSEVVGHAGRAAECLVLTRVVRAQGDNG